jgi:hypothetical protein
LPTVGSRPSLAHRIAVEGEENRCDEEQDDLIDRPRDRKQRKSSDPSQGAWNPTVAGQESYCPDRFYDEGARSLHGATLDRDSCASREVSRPLSDRPHPDPAHRRNRRLQRCRRHCRDDADHPDEGPVHGEAPALSDFATPVLPGLRSSGPAVERPSAARPPNRFA